MAKENTRTQTLQPFSRTGYTKIRRYPKGKGEKTKVYGLHLMIDGYRADKEKLADVSLLYETLNQLPGRLGMHKVGFPHIIQFKDGDIAGISGFVFIMESHISIHTYANKGFISVDAYSCKGFDHKKIVDHLREVYHIKDLEEHTVKRGKKFPVEMFVYRLAGLSRRDTLFGSILSIKHCMIG